MTVMDSERNSNMDTLTITVVDRTPPMAYAGPDQIVDEDTLIEFDGSV